MAGLQILLVEDNDADIYLIKRALAGNSRVEGIVVAHDGVEALELVDSGAVTPDLAIVDLHLPRMDGFALLREFGFREFIDFPSVVLTSSRSGADAVRSKMRGSSTHMIKPVELAKLSSMLNEVISSL